MIIKNETMLKIEILTRGVNFSQKALVKAIDDRAKGQNLVYNLPVDAPLSRPQELFLKDDDGYLTVVSCVAPNGQIEPVKIDLNESGELIAIIEGKIFEGVKITYVKEPEYYNKLLSNNETVKKYVSACGYDELDILPWKGCAISKGCWFCGVNTVANKNETDLFNAFSISENDEIWNKNKDSYLKNLNEAIEIALQDECYDEHVHLLIISGNLSSEKLNFQADIYSEIAEGIKGSLDDRLSEGIVVIMTPPIDITRLEKMKNAGVDVVVFNLEVANEPWFSKYCPGKSELGREFFMTRLVRSVEIFGAGNVWTNFVFGLEPVDKLLTQCYMLAEKGIVAGANVLHLDSGNKIDCQIPSKEEVIYFFSELAKIYKTFGFKPYYCAKALRTSLANEFYEDRIKY